MRRFKDERFGRYPGDPCISRATHTRRARRRINRWVRWFNAQASTRYTLATLAHERGAPVWK